MHISTKIGDLGKLGTGKWVSKVKMPSIYTKEMCVCEYRYLIFSSNGSSYVSKSTVALDSSNIAASCRKYHNNHFPAVVGPAEHRLAVAG